MEHRIKFDSCKIGKQTLALRVLDTNVAWAAAKQIIDYMAQHPEKVFEAVLKPYTEHRSLSANAYCWVLCEQIAKARSLPEAVVTKEDVYREAVRRVGPFSSGSFPNSQIEELQKSWSKNGIGWICDVIGPSDREGRTDMVLYHGSSTYDKEEMGQLLDDLIEDAQAMGLETKPPEEVDRLKSLWEEEPE